MEQVFWCASGCPSTMPPLHTTPQAASDAVRLQACHNSRGMSAVEAARLAVVTLVKVLGVPGGAAREVVGLSRLGTLCMLRMPSLLTDRSPERCRSGEARRGCSGVLPAELLPLRSCCACCCCCTACDWLRLRGGTQEPGTCGGAGVV